jgi:hypothetical protein
MVVELSALVVMLADGSTQESREVRQLPSAPLASGSEFSSVKH